MLKNKNTYRLLSAVAVLAGLLIISFGFDQYEKNIHIGTAVLVIGFWGISLSVMIIATIKLEDAKKIDNKYINYLLSYLKKYDVSIRILSVLTFFLGAYSLLENNFLIGIILMSVATPVMIILIVLLISQKSDLTAY